MPSITCRLMITRNQIEFIRKNPSVWIREVLGRRSDINQDRINKAVANFDRVAVYTCHSIGKTYTVANLSLWFLYNFPPALVITTAPSDRQVENLLWGEIYTAHQNSQVLLGGKVTKMRIEIKKDWYMIGFSPQKTARTKEMIDATEQQGSVFQGWHNNNVLIIFDEAVGIDADIWTQVEGLLTSGLIVKIVCIGNPTTKNCIFYNKVQLPTWKAVQISCFDTPNMIANGFTNLKSIRDEVKELELLKDRALEKRLAGYKKPVPYLLSTRWVMERALEWGIGDARFIGKAIGDFPAMDDFSLIQLIDVEKSQARKHLARENGMRFIGADIARKGTNKTVFTELTEAEKPDDLPVQTRLHRISKRDLMDVTGQLIKFCRFDWDEKHGRQIIVCIDATGLGSGVYDRCKELQKQGKVSYKIRFVEIHFGNRVKTIQRHKEATLKEENEQKAFMNVKALAFEYLAQSLKTGLRIKKEKCYQQQLPTMRYDYTSTGKQYMESKKEYEARTKLNSPDEADSLALANFARRFGRYGESLYKMMGMTL